MLKYKAPAIKALPSLSNEGSEDLLPKYLSSKESRAAKAAFAADVAVDAELDAELAELLAFVACVVAVVAELLAFVAEVAA